MAAPEAPFSGLPRLPAPSTGHQEARSLGPALEQPGAAELQPQRSSHTTSLKSPVFATPTISRPSSTLSQPAGRPGEAPAKPTSPVPRRRAKDSSEAGSSDGHTAESWPRGVQQLSYATRERLSPSRATSNEPLLVQRLNDTKASPAAPRQPVADVTAARRATTNQHRPFPGAKRVYESYPANLLFLCGGRVMTSRPSTQIPLTFPRFGLFPRASSSLRRRRGPAVGRFGEPQPAPPTGPPDDDDARTLALPLQSLFSLGLALVLGILFLASQASYLWHTVSPATPLVFAYLWLLLIVTMFRCAGSDPGIVPRGLDPDPDKVWISAGGGAWDGRPKDMEVGEWEIVPKWARLRRPGGGGAQWVKCKWCQTCESFRPPRSSHCRLCDCCIDGIDHHCQYLNVCIGTRNYGSFAAFVTTAVLALLYVVACCVFRLVHTSLSPAASGAGHLGFVGALRDSPLAFVLAVLCLALAGPVGALWLYHAMLTLRGLTTIDYLRLRSARKFAKRNPAEAAAVEAAEKPPPSLAARYAQADDGAGWSLARTVRGCVERLCRPEIDTYVGWRDWEEGAD